MKNAKPITKLILYGCLTLILYGSVFMNQNYVTEITTKANWYPWENFIQTNKLDTSKKIHLLKNGMLQVFSQSKIPTHLELIKKMKELDEKLHSQKSKLSDNQKLMRWTQLLLSLKINDREMVKQKMMRLNPDVSVILGKRVWYTTFLYILVPIAMVFVFSFSHGVFTGNFWTVLGIRPPSQVSNK